MAAKVPKEAPGATPSKAALNEKTATIVVDPAHASVAAACASAGVPFIGIYGVAGHIDEAQTDAKMAAALARAAPTLSSADFAKLQALAAATDNDADDNDEAATATRQACETGDVVALRAVVASKKIDVGNDTLTGMGHRALHVASRYGHADVVRYLLADVKADPNQACVETGKRALHYAVQHGHVACVRVLLQHGADPSLTDNQGYDPIQGICPPGTAEVFDVGQLKPGEPLKLVEICQLLPAQWVTAAPALRAALKPLAIPPPSTSIRP